MEQITVSVNMTQDLAWANIEMSEDRVSALAAEWCEAAKLIGYEMGYEVNIGDPSGRDDTQTDSEYDPTGRLVEQRIWQAAHDACPA